MASPDVLSGVLIDEKFRSNVINLSRQATIAIEQMVAEGKGEAAERDVGVFASRFDSFAPGQTDRVRKQLLDYVRSQRIQSSTDIDSLLEMIEDWVIPLTDGEKKASTTSKETFTAGSDLAELVNLALGELSTQLDASDNTYEAIKAKVVVELGRFTRLPSWNKLGDKIVDLMTKRLLNLNQKLIKESHYEVWQPPVVTEQEATINRLMTAANILWLLKRGLVGYAPTGGQMGDLESGLIPDDILEHPKFRQALYDNRARL